MQVTLRPITSETVRAVTQLSVAPGQEHFVAPNAVSLSQALFSDEAWYRAIHADDEMVGFVMLADETMKPDPPAVPKVFLWRFMLDQRHQRRGIGREAIRLVCEHARSRSGIDVLYTSYVPGEGSPGPFYLGLGFVPTGEMEGDEIVLVRTLGS
jgi:diamine N-acetyltransferase